MNLRHDMGSVTGAEAEVCRGFSLFCQEIPV
jgi:hypothetical protein